MTAPPEDQSGESPERFAALVDMVESHNLNWSVSAIEGRYHAVVTDDLGGQRGVGSSYTEALQNAWSLYISPESK